MTKYKTFNVLFHKGLRQDGSPRFFNDGECSIAKDCYFDEVGNIFSRKFINHIQTFSNAIKTIFYYNYIDSMIVHDIDGNLYGQYKGSALETDLGSKKFSCVEYNDVLFMANGSSRKRYDGTNVQDIGNDAPEDAPTPSKISLQLSDCNTTWTANPLMTPDVLAYTDQSDYQSNPDDDTDIGSQKFVFSDSLTTGYVVYKNFTSVNLKYYTHVSMWIKSSVNVNSSYMQLLLCDANNCTSVVENLNIPALTAGEWTHVLLEISSPSSCTSIVCIGINITTDFGAATIRIDDVTAVNSDNDNYLDGEYYYKTRYVDANGKLSSSSPASSAINAKKEEINIAVVASSDSKISYINLYRIGGTLSDYYLVDTVSNSDQTITDNTLDSDLITIQPDDENDPLETGTTFLQEHYERLISSKTLDYPNSINFSVEYEPEYNGLNLSNQYLISNRIPCTGLLSWGVYILYSNKKNIFVCEGSNPESWHIRKSDSSYGSLVNFAFYKLPIFLNYFGLFYFNGTYEVNISKIVSNYFKENRNLIKDAILCVFDEKLYCVFPGSKVLVYDFNSKIFYEYSISLTEMYYNYNDGYLYAGDNNKTLVRLEQDTNAGEYDTVNMQIKSKMYPLNDIPNEYGSLKSIACVLNTNSQDVTLNVYIDEELAQSFTINTDNVDRKRLSFDSNLKGRYVEFEFLYSGTKEVEIQTPLIVNPDYDYNVKI